MGGKSGGSETSIEQVLPWGRHHPDLKKLTGEGKREAKIRRAETRRAFLVGALAGSVTTTIILYLTQG